MSDHPPESSPSRSPRIPFFVGVTGHMELHPDDIPEVKKSIDLLFKWLKGEASIDKLGNTPVLGTTKVVLLSSLAPGADDLVARCAQEAGFEVRAPLPFDLEFYRQASTFVRNDGLDEKRLEAFDKFHPVASNKASPGEVSCFHVCRPGDKDLDEEALKRKQKADLKDRTARNYRYRAAGEFIAAFSDLLIAVTRQADNPIGNPPENPAPAARGDKLPEDAEPGAERVVISRLKGLTPGVLPLQSALTWADNGPLVRIFCRKAADAPLTGTPDPQAGNMALWHPLGCTRHFETSQETDRREIDRMRQFIRHLARLNGSLVHHGGCDAGTQINKHLQGQEVTEPVLLTWSELAMEHLGELFRKKDKRKTGSEEVEDVLKPLAPHITGLATLRRMIADINRDHDMKVKNLISRLFTLAVIVIIVFQVYDAFLKNLPDHALAKCLVFGTALLCFTLAWITFYRAKEEELLDWQNDSRGLAEAFRVQLYWTVSGTGESVAWNYLQRAHGDLLWIRSVVSAHAFPYEEARRTFMALDDSGKLPILERVKNGWIDEQRNYFRKQAHQCIERMSVLRFLGSMCLIAGFFLILVNFVLMTCDYAASPLPCITGYALLAVWFTAFPMIWISSQIFTRLAWNTHRPSAHPDQAGNSRLKSMFRHVHSGFRTLLSSKVYLWIAGISLGGAIAFATYAGPAFPGILPPAAELTAMMKNLLLAAGTLFISWAAVKFLTENSRRYSSMAGLYDGASLRMADLLQRYRNQISPQPGHEASSPEERDLTLRSIHELLVGLGREALNENAEWLLMHRDRPVEPVTPAA